MSAAKPAVPVRDLVEEAKKRIVFLAICVVGLSYLMSRKCLSVQNCGFVLIDCCVIVLRNVEGIAEIMREKENQVLEL